MRELAGWEMLLGGALVVWVLWRFGRGSVNTLSRKDDRQAGHNNDQPGSDQTGSDQPGNDWFGLLLPLGAVFLFVLFLIYSMRS